jgi:hypothetical protein
MSLADLRELRLQWRARAGAWTAVRRIRIPQAAKTASNEAVKFDRRSRIRNVKSARRPSGLMARLRACYTVDSLAGFGVTPPRCIRRVLRSMNTRTQEALEQRAIHMQEVDCEDPGCLGPKELPPGRARVARRRVDARGAENLPHGGRRDRHAEFHQFAVDPAVPPLRILPRQANDKACKAWDRRRATRLAPLACVVFLRGQPAVPSQERRGFTGKTAIQRLRSASRASAVNHTRSADSYRTRPACQRSTTFSAGAPAAQHPSAGRLGTARRPGRAPDTSARRRS